MVVYLVNELCDFNENYNRFIGVFSTLEKATEVAEKTFNKDRGKLGGYTEECIIERDTFSYNIFNSDYCSGIYIKEFILDEVKNKKEEVDMSNIYDVNFNVYTSITVEANSREEAEEEFFGLSNEEIIERIVESIKEGGVDVGTIELLEGKEPEEVEDDFDLEGLEF